jgi:hypothetical protein
LGVNKNKRDVVDGKLEFTAERDIYYCNRLLDKQAILIMPENHDTNTNTSPLSSDGFTAFQRAIENLPVDTLRSEIERLHNSTFHLRRTNAELAAAAEENEEDSTEYQLYATENEEVIRANTIKISLIQNQLQRVDPNYSESQPTQITTASESRQGTSGTTNVGQEASDVSSSVPNGHAVNGTVADARPEAGNDDEGVFL